MLIDTDVLIWAFRGNERASDFLDDQQGFAISIVTYMELCRAHGTFPKCVFDQEDAAFLGG